MQINQKMLGQWKGSPVGQPCLCVCVSFDTSMLSGHFTWKLVLKFASFDVTSVQQNLVPRLYKHKHRGNGKYKLLTAITMSFIMVSTGSLSGPGSVVGIATDYDLGGPGIE